MSMYKYNKVVFYFMFLFFVLLGAWISPIVLF